MNNEISAVLLNADEVKALQEEVGRSSLMGKTIATMKKDVEAFMALDYDVPGHGEAGGYEHNRHKQNYNFMNLAGRLFLITKEEKYALFVKELLSLYADKYLQFDFHVQKNTNPTGRLFHQILNEHMWLMYASLAYSCVEQEMSEAEREHIVNNLFQPMLEMFTVKYAHDFDRIHNHGMWAVAAVGICGLAIGKREYLEMSVFGLDNYAAGKKEMGEGGFLAQIAQLFAPSGYYMEGPYYHRFAIRPLCVFAEVLHRHMPELDIYNFKDKVIGNTVQALLATAYPNGEFPALNDASHTMGITDMGVQVAVSLYSKHYGLDDNLLGMAKIQNQVWMHACGLELSRAFEKAQNERPDDIGLPFFPSVELNEGPDGHNGAQGFIRMQDGKDVFQLVMNYGQHGMGHGHFDTLGITYFNRGQEVLREYGFGRWVNVEPKFGGRYLDENKSYARQTIAHNAVTIDEKCQNNFDADRADTVHGLPHFFKVDDAKVNGMSAFANDHYQDFGMQRSVFMLKLDELEAPLLLDLYRLTSEDNKTHQFDYSHQYEGQIVRTNFDYQANQELDTLGENFGYQHLWNVAGGEVKGAALVSWLQNNTYYTWLGASSNNDGEVIFTRSGANDPSFNLRSEPAFILRAKGQSSLFASVLETHGYFNEEFEQSVNARGHVQDVCVIAHNDVGSVVEIETAQSVVTFMVSNQLTASDSTAHQVLADGKTYQWNGFYSLEVQVK